MNFLKYGLPATFAALVMSSSAMAHHGAEYNLSACDKSSENTAHLILTTKRNYQNNPVLQQKAQQTFKKLMSRHSAEQHVKLSRIYVYDLVSTFKQMADNFIKDENIEFLDLDFHHPHTNKGGPATKGCVTKTAFKP